MKSLLQEMSAELESILNWWRCHTVDHFNGGFYGRVSETNVPDPLAAKGAVLNCRILWSFSRSYALNKKETDLAMAHRAFDYVVARMLDTRYGGLFWSVEATGIPLDMHKQIYAQAFGIYALSEYAKATGNQQAIKLAAGIFELIEQFSLDKENGGYTESFECDWKKRDDQRLSAKEINAPKTMNTHLHLLEAYANLYEVWPTGHLQEKTRSLLELFIEYFIDKKTFHLHQFYDLTWNKMPGAVSYGHDVEAAWLLCECAEKIDTPDLLRQCQDLSLRLIDAGLEGLDADGGLWYEFEPHTKSTIREKHWWPQAEMQVALFHAWQLTANQEYLTKLKMNFSFIKAHIRDNKNGEWIWGTTGNNQRMEGQDKAGIWKGPYHNSRCCQELIIRIRRSLLPAID